MSKTQIISLIKTAIIQLALSTCVSAIFFALSKSLDISVLIGIAVFLYTLRGLYRDYMKIRDENINEDLRGQQ